MTRYDPTRTQTFLCVLCYKTPAGDMKDFSCVVDALAADLALTIAERRLRSDKRRRVAAIPYGEAMLAPRPQGQGRSTTACDDQFEGEPA